MKTQEDNDYFNTTARVGEIQFQEFTTTCAPGLFDGFRLTIGEEGRYCAYDATWTTHKVTTGEPVICFGEIKKRNFPSTSTNAQELFLEEYKYNRIKPYMHQGACYYINILSDGTIWAFNLANIERLGLRPIRRTMWNCTRDYVWGDKEKSVYLVPLQHCTRLK